MEFVNFFFSKEIGSVEKNEINWIVDYYSLKTNSEAKFGKTDPDRKNHVINIYINPAALDFPIVLYLTVGHELVHANDVNNRNEGLWYERYPKYLNTIMEWHAYQWSSNAEIGFGYYEQVKVLDELKAKLPPGFFDK